MSIQFPVLPPELWTNIFQYSGATELSKLSRVCHLFNNMIQSTALAKTWKREVYNTIDSGPNFVLLLNFLLDGGTDWRELFMTYQTAQRTFTTQKAYPSCDSFSALALLQAKDMIDPLINLEGYFFIDHEDWEEQIPVLQKARERLQKAETYEGLFLSLQKAHKEQSHNPEILYYLSECYFRGIGIEADPIKAFEHAHVSAQHNLPHARSLLGICLVLGIGCESNMDEALRWLDPPLTPQAKFFLANHLRTLQQPNPLIRAFQLTVEAAESGHAEAQSQAGLYYLLGSCEENLPVVAPIDHQKAFHFFFSSAKQGYFESLHHLGECFLRGLGIPQNFAKGLVCFKLASRYGFARYCSTEGFLAIEDLENRRKMWRFLKKEAQEEGINSRMALWSIKKQLSEAEIEFLDS